MLTAVVLLSAVSAPFSAASRLPHPASVSSTVCHIEPGRALVDLRFQTASLLEALPRLDGDLDGRFTEAELSAAEAEVGDYLCARWRLLQPPFDDADALEGKLISLGFATDLLELDASFQWIDGRLELSGEGALEDLVVHSNLFTERDPYHRDFLTLTYADEVAWTVPPRAGGFRWRFRSARLRAPEVRATFFRAGLSSGSWRYALGFFLLAAAVAAHGPRHGLGGLALVVLGLALGGAWRAFAPEPPARFVFLALPLALAYVGAESLMRRTPRTPWVEAPLFGVLLALSIAAMHADAFEGEPLVRSAALGLSAAVLLLTVAAGLVALLCARLLPGARTHSAAGDVGFAANWLFLCVSALGVLAGLGVFLARTGWFG